MSVEDNQHRTILEKIAKQAMLDRVDNFDTLQNLSQEMKLLNKPILS